LKAIKDLKRLANLDRLSYRAAVMKDMDSALKLLEGDLKNRTEIMDLARDSITDVV